MELGIIIPGSMLDKHQTHDILRPQQRKQSCEAMSVEVCMNGSLWVQAQLYDSRARPQLRATEVASMRRILLPRTSSLCTETSHVEAGIPEPR